MIIEIIALLVSYSGVFIGKYLSNAAKEEVKDGKNYLLVFKKSLAFLILSYFFFLMEWPIKMFPLENMFLLFYDLFTFFVILMVLMFLDYDYAIFGVLFGLNPAFLMAFLIFIYGFPTGSLMKDNYFKILEKTWIYVLLGLIFLIIGNTF
ncbi:MAG: hypothetical protein AABW88_00475 [Nanoarchaeota archaeon]